jgi:peptidoglycan hydrolase-like protein with peptidoglycan-binding domain
MIAGIEVGVLERVTYGTPAGTAVPSAYARTGDRGVCTANPMTRPVPLEVDHEPRAATLADEPAAAPVDATHGRLDSARVLALQRSIGNRGVARLLLQRGPLPAFDIATPEILATTKLKAIALGEVRQALRKGETGEHVAVFKTLLARSLPFQFGAAEDPVSGADRGKFEPETVEAVEVLQDRYGLQPADGAAGGGTLRALDRACVFAAGLGAGVLGPGLKIPADADAPTAAGLLVAAHSRLRLARGETDPATQRAALFASFDRQLAPAPAWRIFRLLMALRQSFRPLFDEYWTWSWTWTQDASFASDRVRDVGVFVTNATSSRAADPASFSGDLSEQEVEQLRRMAAAGQVTYDASTGQAGATAAWDVGGMFALPTTRGQSLTPDQQAIVDEIRTTRSVTAKNLYLQRRSGDWGDKADTRVYSRTIGEILPTEVREAAPDSFPRFAWKEFGTEGSAASINTWDPGRLSYGAGWAAAGELPGLLTGLAAKDPAFISELFQVGISVTPGRKGVSSVDRFHVVDVDQKCLIAGDRAMRYLQHDDEVLSALIASGESSDHYQQLLDAQWERLKAIKFPWLNDPRSRWHRRPWQLATFAAHGMHWASIYTIDLCDRLLGDDDNVYLAIWTLLKMCGHYAWFQNGALVAADDKPRVGPTNAFSLLGRGGYAGVIWDLGKDERGHPLISNYVSAPTVLPENFAGPEFEGIAFLPVGYHGKLVTKPGDPCVFFSLSPDLDRAPTAGGETGSSRPQPQGMQESEPQSGEVVSQPA